jgi:hypothetical protein
MGTICLSPAPNLRCVGLSLTEEVITLIPVALEMIFSLGLVLTGRDAGRCVHGSLGILSDVLTNFFAQHSIHSRCREPNIFSAGSSQRSQSRRPNTPNLSRGP